MPLIEGTRDPQRAADRASLADWAATIDAMLTTVAADKAEIVSDLATLNSTTWDGLTAAQRTAAIRRLATRQQHLLTGSERLLKALAVLVRRGGGG